MADKLEDLEMRFIRNNMRMFGVLKGTESQSGSVAKFVDTWLREELGLDTEMQIQRAHRATVPKLAARGPTAKELQRQPTWRIEDIKQKT